MGSRPVNSTNPNHSSGNNDDGDDNKDSGAAVAVAAVAGVAALAAWGLSKWFGNSEPEPKLQHHMLSSSSSSTTTRNNDQGNPGGYNNNNNNNNPTIEGKWRKPSWGCFKVNTDASVLPEIGKAAAGGLIRDHSGRWIVGFTACLDLCDPNSAELQAVREGVRLAWERGLRSIEVETDSEAALILINKDDFKLHTHKLGSIVQDIRKLMKLDWELIKFSHVDRGMNKCADALAKKGRYQNESLIIWEQPPGNVRDLVANEMTNNI